MNPGYLSLLLLCMTAVLWVTGWKDSFLEGVSARVLLLFYASLVLLGPILIQAFSISLYLGYIVIGFTAIGMLFTSRDGADRTYLVSASLLIASFYLLLTRLYISDPVLIIYSPFSDPALLIVLVTVLLFRKPTDQIAAISIGMVVGEAAMIFAFPAAGKEPSLGSAFWNDQWWLAVVAARALTVLYEEATQFIGKLGRLIHSRLDHWRRS